MESCCCCCCCVLISSTQHVNFVQQLPLIFLLACSPQQSGQRVLVMDTTKSNVLASTQTSRLSQPSPVCALRLATFYIQCAVTAENLPLRTYRHQLRCRRLLLRVATKICLLLSRVAMLLSDQWENNRRKNKLVETNIMASFSSQ